MSDNLYTWFKLGQIGTGRRLTLYSQWRPLLKEYRLDDELEYLDRARAHDQHTLELEVRWKTRESSGTYGPETVALDNVLDRMVVAVHDMAALQTSGLPDDHPTAVASARVRSTAFPLGVNPVINASFVDQAAEVERMIGEFRTSLKADVKTLHLGEMIDRLETTAKAYRQAVDAGNRRLTYDEVHTAQQRGLSYVAELLVRILARFFDSDDPEQVTARNRFLAPLAAHDEQERAARANRRRSGADDEPENEEPGESEAEEPGESEAEEPGESEAEEPGESEAE